MEGANEIRTREKMGKGEAGREKGGMGRNKQPGLM